MYVKVAMKRVAQFQHMYISVCTHHTSGVYYAELQESCPTKYGTQRTVREYSCVNKPNLAPKASCKQCIGRDAVSVQQRKQCMVLCAMHDTGFGNVHQMRSTVVKHLHSVRLFPPLIAYMPAGC